MCDERLIESVKAHEGLMLSSYLDTEGHWTIGYGTNLETLTITESQADEWLRSKLTDCKDTLDLIPEFRMLNRARQNVLIEMTYNLGLAGLMKFSRMWLAIQNAAYKTAAAEMLDSRWARQVGRRAETLSTRMSNG